MPGMYEDNVFLLGQFDEAMEHELIVPLTIEIKKQAELKEGQIDLYINSPGGYIYLMEHIVQLMERAKAQGVMVRTIVPEMAYSCGSMVAIAGTIGERYIGRRAEHLAHYGQSMTFQTTPLQAERFAEATQRNFKNNLAHYKKYCDIPNLDSQMLDDGFFIPAARAIKWNLADKYMDKLEV
jgi:ATP-dependent protease ClpP protease subunit